MNKQEIIEITPEAQALAKQTEDMVEIYKSYAIIDNPSYVNAAEDLKKIKQKASELEEQRKSMTRPLDESKKRIMDFFRKPLNLLAQMEATIKSSMLKFQREEEIRRQEEQKKLDKLAKKNGLPAPVIPTKVEKVTGVKTKTLWRFRIKDEKKIPREYLIPNEKMLGQLAEATKGSLEIPGVEFYPEEIIAATRG